MTKKTNIMNLYLEDLNYFYLELANKDGHGHKATILKKKIYSIWSNGYINNCS